MVAKGVTMNSYLSNTTAMLIGAGDAAKALAISPRKLWELTASGKIPCVRIGRSVRYKPEDLTAWIDAHRQPIREGRVNE
jgi:excisionase family DNA binding protein